MTPVSRRAIGVLTFAFFACTYDKSYRQDPVPAEPPVCALGAIRCDQALIEACSLGVDGEAGWAPQTDCGHQSLVCAQESDGTVIGCRACQPGSPTCGGDAQNRVDTCRADGSGYDPGTICEGQGIACREGVCDNLCAVAAKVKSNVGCEYWGVDLDNADISASLNAAAQQYAIVVSNPQPDVSANVEVDEDDADIGQAQQLRVVQKTRVSPQNLQVLLLGPREVDGPNIDPTLPLEQRTNSALTRRAYRVTSDVPIIAYQFNPLDNVNVFSNDASLLKPVEAIAGGAHYVVVGWPQTIATSDDPNTDFGVDLRSFLTIVGTREQTSVTVTTTADIVAGLHIDAQKKGETKTYTLQPFEVLNLESGAFGADFTGSIIDANGPAVVFSGSEAADAPHWDAIADRSCCADHLEQQLDPARTAGRRFVVGHVPNRAHAVNVAGAANVGAFNEPEYVRVVAVASGKTHVRTTLPAPDDDFYLQKPGDFREIVYFEDFSIESDAAIHIGDVQVSQDGAGVPRGLPGGDPSFLLIPPVEQFRDDYVFLTPDKYNFDFVTILAPKGTNLLFDGASFDADACETAPVAAAVNPVTNTTLGDGYTVWRCQLSFPVIDLAMPAAQVVQPGRQNDGVHHLQADHPVGLIVYGFDGYVSYIYAGGTELEVLTPR